MLHDTVIGRTDDFTSVGDLFDAVGTPASDTRDGKEGGIEFNRYIAVSYTHLDVYKRQCQYKCRGEPYRY